MTTRPTSVLIRTKSIRNRESSNLNDNQMSYNSVILRNQNQFVVGRDRHCDLNIKSIEISRKHAIFQYIDNHWFITDLESTNGLFVNGRQLSAFIPCCLKNGDQISLGPLNKTEFIYQFVNNYLPSDHSYCSRLSNIDLNSKSVSGSENLYQNCSEDANRLSKETGKSSKRKTSDRSDGSESNRKVMKATEVKPENDVINREIEEILNTELSCTICHELFVEAVNLNCSHTFCLVCIEQWKHSNGRNQECPVCRQRIVSQNRALVLDNLIDNLVNRMRSQQKEYRKKLIEQRKKQFIKLIHDSSDDSSSPES